MFFFVALHYGSERKTLFTLFAYKDTKAQRSRLAQLVSLNGNADLLPLSPGSGAELAPLG